MNSLIELAKTNDIEIHISNEIILREIHIIFKKSFYYYRKIIPYEYIKIINRNPDMYTEKIIKEVVEYFDDIMTEEHDNG